MSARVMLLVFAALLAGLVAGCGGGDDEGDSTTTVVTETGGDDGEGGGGGSQAIEVDGKLFNPAAIYDKVSPGIVTVSSIFGSSGEGATSELGQDAQAGQGSGFVISNEGEIVTNAHVVTDAEASQDAEINAADEVYVEFLDRNQVPAEIIGFDPFADVALIKVDPEGLDLQPLEFGDIDDVSTGEPVAAIGSPFGETQSLSIGIVSQVDRSIPSLTPFNIDGAIQTDASINPGNSGGPLLNAAGTVIGINQQIDTTNGGNQGVGFAVPVDLAMRSVEQLREDGEVEYAYIGVTTAPLYPQLADELEIDAKGGALVQDVVTGGPADEAGICCDLTLAEQRQQAIRFQANPGIVPGGDVIVAVDGEEILTQEDLPRIVARLEPGTDTVLEVIRDGDRQKITVKLQTRPESAPNDE